MSLVVSQGPVLRAQKNVFYGPEGVGKSLLASLFPTPVFMDVEQGSHHLNVARTEAPQSFQMVNQITDQVLQDPGSCQTFVVDTVDWVERHAIGEVCSELNVPALGGNEDYGHTFNVLRKKMAQWLDKLTEIVTTKGIHVVLLAHSMTRKFELPEEMGAFDKWELKLEKKVCPIIREWADNLIFYSYKTLVEATDKKGRVKKGVGGARVLRTQHHPTWDAKNRYDWPYEIEITEANKTVLPTELYQAFYSAAPATPQPTSHEAIEERGRVAWKEGGDQAALPVAGPTTVTKGAAPSVEPTPQQQTPVNERVSDPDPVGPAPQPTPLPEQTLEGIPAALLQLMETHNITEEQVRQAVATRGHYPVETPITNYDQTFIDGVLISAWDQVVKVIKNLDKGAKA